MVNTVNHVFGFDDWKGVLVMISKKMEALGVKKSVIREIFEYAKK